MLFLIALPTARDRILTMTLTLEQLEKDTYTRYRMREIQQLQIAEYIIIRHRIVIIRIQ